MSTDFKIRIMPFLIKIFVFNFFYNTDKQKRGAKLFAPKSGNHCHFWAVLGVISRKKKILKRADL